MTPLERVLVAAARTWQWLCTHPAGRLLVAIVGGTLLGAVACLAAAGVIVGIAAGLGGHVPFGLAMAVGAGVVLVALASATVAGQPGRVPRPTSPDVTGHRR